MKKIFVPIFIIILGIVVLTMPNIVSYFDTSSFYFDLSTFLNDHPSFAIPSGVLLIVCGLIYIFLIIINSIREKTAFVIQKADEDDYGNINLIFPKIFIGNRDQLVYENVVTLENNNKDIIDLEKKKIKKFYTRIDPNKDIAFLGISAMPTLVYAGYVVGNSGRKVSFYHWDRDKTKARRLKSFGKSEELIETKNIMNNSKQYVFCVSTSYQINEDIVVNQFPRSNVKFYGLKQPHYNSVMTMTGVNKIANFVRKEIQDLPKESTVCLLLSCSSEICFAIGQRLNSPALPEIKVYNFNNKNRKNCWDWSITLK